MRLPATAALPLLLLLLLPPAHSQTPAWGVLEGEHLSIYAETGEAEARQAAEALHDMEAGMAALWGPIPSQAPPLRVYLFRNLDGLRSMGARGFSRGFFQSGPDSDFIAVLGAGDDTLRSLRHEFVHRVLYRTSRRVPGWIEEGLAELYSTLTRTRDGWQVGLPIESHVDALRLLDWAALPQLAQMGDDDETWNRAGGVMRYYGQSWAIVHLLAVGSERASRFPALLDRLRNGESLAAALQSEFALSPDALLREARARILSGRLPARLSPGPAPPPATPASWRTLPHEDVAAFMADLAIATGSRAADDRWLRELQRAGRTSPKSRIRLGILALRQGRKTEAEAHLRAAIDRQTTEPAAWFELAMLVRERDSASPEVRRLLEQTLQLNSGHPEALYLLAMEEQRTGHPDRARALLERARAVLPRQFSFREALARLYWDAGLRDQAQAEAQAALTAARNPDERSMAIGLLDEFRRAATRPSAATPKPEVTVPRGWLEPRRDGEIEGSLVRVECGNPVMFEFDTESGLRRFRANPARLMISGRPQDQPFSCGEQSAKPRVKARFRNQDLLVQIVFLD